MTTSLYTLPLNNSNCPLFMYNSCKYDNCLKLYGTLRNSLKDTLTIRNLSKSPTVFGNVTNLLKDISITRNLPKSPIVLVM